MRGHRDLERVSAGAVVCALLAVLVPWELVRIAAAVPLTLLLPGYAIVAALFLPSELAPPKLWTLSVGISLAVLALGALLLNVFSFGLTTVSWAVLLVMVIVACCRGAALRRGRAQKAGRRRRRPALATRDLGLIGAAVLIAVGALVLAQKPLQAEKAQGFTALWVLPEDARDEAVVVGVQSSEQDPVSYRLELSQGRKRRQDLRFDLDPGEERTFRFEAPHGPGGRTRVVASLYQSERPGHLYRSVKTWLPRQETFPR